MGDLNINLLEHETHQPRQNFLVNLQSLNFFPHISRPTRFPDSLQLGDPSLLDHIYTNFNGDFSSGIIHFPISDHLPIFWNIIFPSETSKFHKIEFKNITQRNKQLFSHKLSIIQWDQLLSTQNVDTNCNIFLDKIQELYDECFPLKTKYISTKRLLKPWITQAVLKFIKNKNNLYNDFKIGAITETH